MDKNWKDAVTHLSRAADLLRQATELNHRGGGYTGAYDAACDEIRTAANLLGLAVTAGCLQESLDCLAGKGSAADNFRRALTNNNGLTREMVAAIR